MPTFKKFVRHLVLFLIVTLVVCAIWSEQSKADYVGTPIQDKSPVNFSKPPKWAQDMYDRMVFLSGAKGTHFFIVNFKDLNAMMSPDGTLLVTRGTLTFAENKHNRDIVAAAIGHELGHWMLGHLSGNDYSPRQQELDADAFGTRISTRAGYECRAGAIFFSYLAQFDPGRGDEDGIHPPHKLRIRLMNEMCDEMGK